MAEFQWTSQQDRALKEVSAWLSDSSRLIYRLDGYAGTGKTTLAKHLAQQVSDPVYFMAYTGKAASVLQKNGCPNASTIHSILYAPKRRSQERLQELITMEKAAQDTGAHEDDLREFAAEIRLERMRLRKPLFEQKEESELSTAGLIVVDEHSMINEEVGRDLEMFGKKILLLGDPMQLPPVRGTGYFMDGEPDLMLTEITRQALDSPIIRYATKIRNGESLPYANDGDAMKVPADRVRDDMLPRAGQLLCGKNKTRHDLNAKMRKELGYTSALPERGERLVCLRNDRDKGLLNGIIVNATMHANCDDTPAHVPLKRFKLNIASDDLVARDVFVNALPFMHPDKCEEGWTQEGSYPMEFGYALTVHKAQGSQWPRVTVMDDGFGKREPLTRLRWLYTAVTRASEKLVIVG